jgi:hypothetical protein
MPARPIQFKQRNLLKIFGFVLLGLILLVGFKLSVITYTFPFFDMMNLRNNSF